MTRARPALAALVVTSTSVAADPIDDARGLNREQVQQRLADGRANRTTQPTSRPAWSIIRTNVLTRFNALLGSLCVLILVVGPVQDALFGLVIVANSAVGVIAEMRAKRTLDRLRVLTASTAQAVREGELVSVAVDQVVVDDVIEAHSGDQVVADGVVLSAMGADADESLLTGEADPVRKQPGDEVLSGSAVAAGSLRYRATKVGPHAYANILAREAREFTTPPSELRDGINTFLRWVTWALIPAGVILVLTQHHQRGTAESIRLSVAAVVGMVPEGLVLLVSGAFALAVVRLARHKVLVQQLPAVETLARVDVVCLDKTGTLTDSRRLRILAIEDLDPELARDERDAALGALAAADSSPNASLRAIGASVPMPDGWSAHHVVPFSSSRRWSGADFGERGRWVLGAPDRLLTGRSASSVLERSESLAGAGQRVLLLARADWLDQTTDLPQNPRPVALVVLAETLRPEAAATVRYFTEQGIAVKVLSGDHPRTVFAVAESVGIPGGGPPVDGGHLPTTPDELRRILDDHAVLGRVAPQQKRIIVQALQDAGHSVAMVGDGVNDIPAMKSADLAVAMGSGAPAARAVAEIVLINDSFAALPQVTREGRRVVANMEKVAKLFLSKSVYAFLLIVAVGIAGLPFPFVPRHLTLVGTLTIGLPAIVLALGTQAPRLEPGFVKRTARFALPAGLVAALATFAAYALARTARDVSPIESRTTATMAVLAIGLVLVGLVAAPTTASLLVLLLAMAVVYAVVLAVPATATFFQLDAPPAVVVLAAIGSAALALWGLWLVGTAGALRLKAPGSTDLTRPAPDVVALCDAGEGPSLEYKSSLRWDINERKPNKALERAVTKTTAGFLNRRGGTLLIGVNDAGAPVGLGEDYATLSRPDRDGFERHLMQVLAAGLGSHVRRFLTVYFAVVNGNDVCALSVRPSDGPVYLQDGSEARLYVRTGNATTPLALNDAVNYVGTRWPGRTTGHLLEAFLGRHT
ncbi:MAG: cation-transporting P-type ATPase [Pseudonocardiales bacterium]|jgi:cation-transporting ATPase E|nr:cation-transporting P-type ATPase [Pseudonocardiales bacterium]